MVQIQVTPRRTIVKETVGGFQAWFKLELQKTLLIPPPNRQVHRQFGGALGGPQVMLPVILEAKNSTATAKYAEGGWGRHFLLPKKGLF